MVAPPRLPQSHIRIHATEDPSTRTRTPHTVPWGTPKGITPRKRTQSPKDPHRVTPCTSPVQNGLISGASWSVAGRVREDRVCLTCFPLRRLEQQTPTCSQFWKLEVSEIEVSTGGVTGRTRGWLAIVAPSLRPHVTEADVTPASLPLLMSALIPSRGPSPTILNQLFLRSPTPKYHPHWGSGPPHENVGDTMQSAERGSGCWRTGGLPFGEMKMTGD